MATVTVKAAGETATAVYTVPPSGVTHGDQIGLHNTGPRVARSAVSGSVSITSANIASLCTGAGTQTNPYVYAAKAVSGTISVTANSVYLVVRDCTMQSIYIPDTRSGPLVRIEWCGIGSQTSYVGGTSGLVGLKFDIYRCWVMGGSDALRMQAGNSVATECYLRCRQGSSTDHNDTIQNYGALGALTVQRCYIDAYLYEINENASGIYQGGDYGSTDSSLSFTITFKDNYVNGAGIHWRLYGGQAAPNMRYVVTGNKHGRIGSPYIYTTSKANDATSPSQITWSNNRWADNGALIPFS